MAKNRFQDYKPRTQEQIKTRINYRGGGIDYYIDPKFKMYKCRDGKNIIRILPPRWANADNLGVTIFLNYGIGPENQTYLSPSKMKGEPDPMAEAKAKANREGDEKLAKQLSPTERVLVWLIDRQAEEEGPQWWGMPLSVERAMATLSVDEDTKAISEIDSPINGRDFRFYKEGQGLNTRYPAEKMKLLAPSPLSEDDGLAEEWYDFVGENKLPDILQFYDYDHISGVFDGKVRSEEDEDAEPAPRRAKPQVEHDEDGVVLDDPPQKKANGRPTVVEDDDDEEAEPAPAAKPTGGSIRDRLAARHKAAPKSAPFDEDD